MAHKGNWNFFSSKFSLEFCSAQNIIHLVNSPYRSSLDLKLEYSLLS